MRTYLVESSAALIDEPKTDVCDWIDLLTKEFTSKGILHDFTNASIPASKKKLSVNRAEIRDKSLKRPINDAEGHINLCYYF